MMAQETAQSPSELAHALSKLLGGAHVAVAYLQSAIEIAKTLEAAESLQEGQSIQAIDPTRSDARPPSMSHAQSAPMA